MNIYTLQCYNHSNILDEQEKTDIKKFLTSNLTE